MLISIKADTVDDEYLVYTRALPCNWFLYMTSIRRAVRSPMDAGSGPDAFNITKEMHRSEVRHRPQTKPFLIIWLVVADVWH
jgi:hypothetical protein